MPNILIRGVADTDADILKDEAAVRGVSVQKLVADLLHDYAAAERNRRLLADHGRYLASTDGPPADFAAIRAEVDREADERTAELIRIAGLG